MRRLALLIIGAMVGIGNLSAQPYYGYNNRRPSSHAFYAEWGGPGINLSANFDGRFNASDRLGWGYRIGLGYGTEWIDNPYYPGREDTPRSYATIPLGINYLFGDSKTPHTLEAGFGGTILTREVAVYTYDNDYDQRGNFIGYAAVSYRRQPLTGGFMWRASILTIIGTSGHAKFSAGVSLGYAF